MKFTPAQQQLLFSAAKALLGAIVIMALSAVIQQAHTGTLDLAVLIDEGVTVFAALMGKPLYDHVPPHTQETINSLENIVHEQVKLAQNTVPLPGRDKDEPITAMRLTAIVKPPTQP